MLPPLTPSFVRKADNSLEDILRIVTSEETQIVDSG